MDTLAHIIAWIAAVYGGFITWQGLRDTWVMLKACYG